MCTQENVYFMFLPNANNIARNLEDYVPRTFKGICDSYEKSRWIVSFEKKRDLYMIYDTHKQRSRFLVCGEAVATFFNGYFLALQNS